MKRWIGFEHGVNLGGWLSQCCHTKERYDTFIVESDIERIAGWGLDHIRVPVDYNLVEDAEGNYREEGFAYVQKIIDWSRKYGLNMVLDLHKTYGFSFDEGEQEAGFFENEIYQERFCRLWEQFATRFARYEDTLAFELLNEVTDKAYCDSWNRISNECIERIRVIAPTIRILVGGYYNNSIEALRDLLPPHDENIVYNFHCYNPVIFTHQGAPWVSGMDTGFRLSVHASYREMKEWSGKYTWREEEFPGLDPESPLGEEYFLNSFAEAVQIAEERDVPLYCGEYGVIDRAEPADALCWYQLISSAFERCGIGRAAWSYKEMDFGLVDPHLEPVAAEVIRLL